MIFYEEVYDKINEDYLNGEISYEMAEAANDLAYDTYITVEEAENVSSANPDPGKIKSLLSKLQNKLNRVTGQGTRINSALKKMGNEIDVNKTIINKIKKGNKNDITSQEMSIFKKLQQNIVSIAKSTAKMIKEYLSVIDWKLVALTGAMGSVAGATIIRKSDMDAMELDRKATYEEKKFAQALKKAGYHNANQCVRDKHNHLVQVDTKLNNMKVHPIKSKVEYAGKYAAINAGKNIALQLLFKKKMKKLEKDSGIESLISNIITDISKYANMLQIKLDKSVTAMFDKFKKSK